MMAIPKLVTGYLNPNAKLVKSGDRRGVRYEIYYDASPSIALRQTVSPLRRFRGHYASVVYYPLDGIGSPESEAEQIDWSMTVDQAVEKADAYIERIWEREMGWVPRTQRRRRLPPEIASENPLSDGNVVLFSLLALGVGGAVGYLLGKNAAPAPTTATITASTPFPVAR